VRRALTRIALLFALFLSLALAVRATVKWWQGTLAMTPWDWLWLALLLPLLYVYLRYFSVLGCKDGCTLPADERQNPAHK